MSTRSSPFRLWSRMRADRWTLAALVLLISLVLLTALAPLLPLADPAATELTKRLLPPISDGHVLGTDHLGRDLLARLLYGARLSLSVALWGVLVAALGGSVLGLVAGYYGGLVDNALMRGVDVLMAFPYLLLALAIVAVLGPGLENATIAIAIVNIPFFARTVRGQALALKREAFVDAARVAGFGDIRILRSEILPGLASTILVAASTSSGWMILETAGLSFLGLGAQPPAADLGGMLGQGRHLLTTAPHVSLIPGAFIFIVVALLNLMGDGLRDALDPRHGGRDEQGQKATKQREARAKQSKVTERAKDTVAGKGQEELLCIDALTVHFGAFAAVKGVSFELRAGEKLALVGESGSGKSVTALAVLRLLDGPQSNVSGTLSFKGRHLGELAPAKLAQLRGGRIAWVPQDPMSSLHPLMRIEQQLGESLALHQGLTGSPARSAALKLLGEVGILDPEARLRAFPQQLSGGMRQRVVIAMALAGNPELLIADEPTTALDVTTQASVLARLRQLCDARKMALLFISHDLAVVSQLCDRVMVLHQGRIVESGPVRQILHTPEHAYTKRLLEAVPRLGNPNHILAPPEVYS